MDDVCAAVDAALPGEVGGIEVHSFNGAVLVPAVGVVVELSLKDKATGEWSSGEVVAVGAGKLAAPAKAVARFERAVARLADARIAGRAMRSDVAKAIGLEAPEYPDDAFAPTPADEARRADRRLTHGRAHTTIPATTAGMGPACACAARRGDVEGGAIVLVVPAAAFHDRMVSGVPEGGEAMKRRAKRVRATATLTKLHGPFVSTAALLCGR
jgi:hypothetical protein